MMNSTAETQRTLSGGIFFGFKFREDKQDAKSRTNAIFI